ncbi:MAG: serine acetyltransferase [Clostridia bacterium]|nr:serine acetyltransferase [Clostridia bacterium]
MPSILLLYLAEMRFLMNILMLIRYIIPSLMISMDEKLCKDLERWKEIHRLTGSDYFAMAQLLWRNKEFRNLVIYRNRHHAIRRRIVELFYPPMDTLYIDAFEIGGGLYIQHGFATMIAAKSIGENFWVNQQVTIGYNGQGDPPVIGDNVMITCGAKVLGQIHVGNDVTIGANAVVIRDVPDNCVVGGVPAKILKQNMHVS